MTIEEFERLQEPSLNGNGKETSSPPKRKYTRKPAAAAKPPAGPSKKSNTLQLTGAQLVKLYGLLTGGGQLIISSEDEYHVSRDSLDLILPILLEKL